MSTAASTIEKPATTGNTNPPSRLRHIYCKCSRDAETRTAFCGHVRGPGAGTVYDPRIAHPDLCNVCVDLQPQGCPRCKK